ncbi:glycosyltransferase family 2 protein [Actinomadura craniellae]|uniref:Glycosyltransferase family 2 protein n=1 Tax=Actinomadura craniellae TaxID=2231787 RepID=A0A365H549_9ACTN|nr:glycosyltransferase [Actinomadura craniellae]RAY14221.1 glycosyltransferase family 2 protein [Actinomadura craniellae]
MTTVTQTPDVSVVVAVYNTMPYLTECLDSLVGQSIGLPRLEIIAVDDGSTDGSGEELDRYAERYPDTVKVLHQPNSGGPATPSNRALDQATGRFVYFVGADDRLGPEALERLVRAADEHDSDIVIGKMVGAGGRYVHQALFTETRPEVTFTDSALPWTLSNCKLFRRELVERHGLRFPEDMRVGSDQPFTIEACFRARRVSVLADYEYYHAVRRADSGNITFASTQQAHLDCAERLLEFTAGLLPPGPARDAIAVRHFTWEVAKPLRTEFLDYPPDEQEKLVARIRDLSDRHLTEAIRAAIDVRWRVRLSLAQRGAMDDLKEAIRQDAEGAGPPIVLAAGRAHLRYSGFGTESPEYPDAWFVADGDLAGRLGQGLGVSSLAWQDGEGKPVLAVTARLPLAGEGALDPAVVRAGVVPVPGRHVPAPRRLDVPPEIEPVRQVTCTPAPDGTGTDVRIGIPVAPLIEAQADRPGRYSVRLYVVVGGATYEVPLPMAGFPPQLRRWYRARPYRVSVMENPKGRLLIAIAPIRASRVVRQRLRRLVPAARKEMSSS